MAKKEWMKGVSKDSQELGGFLDKGCSFEGKLAFDGLLQINGDFRGEIFSDGTLIIGPDATVAARVQVDTIIIDGNVEGMVEAKSRIELHRSGRLVANVTASTFVIEEGGIFHGSSNMQRAGAALSEGADDTHDDYASRPDTSAQSAVN